LQAGQGLNALLSAIDSLPDAVLVLDSNDRVSHYNAALVTLYGDAARFLAIGKTFADLISELAVSGQRYRALPESANALRDGKRRRVAVALPDDNNDISGTTQIVRSLALHALAPCDYEELTAEGRWLHVATRQVPQGGHIIIHHDITIWKARELQLEHTVLHDPETGLPNRTLFMDRLAQELRRCARDRDRKFGVVLIDVDRFRIINQDLGPEKASAVLAAVARRLERVGRPSDTVAHLEGDAFGCLIDGVLDERDAYDFARRVNQALGEPIRIDTQDIEIKISITIGIAIGNRLASSGGDLVRDASIALSRAKDDPGTKVAIFDSVMQNTTLTRYRLDTRLRQAIRRKELRLAYQPIVEIETFRVAGFEGLARWGREGVDAVTPTIFVEVAEQSDLIVPLGRLALESAARELTTWIEHNPDIFVTVNISPRQFDEHDLVKDLKNVIEDFSLPRESLHLEITESTVVENPEKVAEALAELKRLGVRICIDDFGTGYSSLHLLQAMPYDVLKIDRSFISTLDSSPRSQIIVETITEMAHRIGMRVVAEGIERHDQLAMIRRAGCDFAQGCLFAPALEAEEAARVAISGRLEVG
jgi:diguanylate cyclase (GGDEF)-like protein